MDNYFENTKFNLKSKKLSYSIKLFLVGIILFLVCDRNNINEVRSIFDSLNVRNVDRIIIDYVLPFKALFDISQTFNLFFIVIQFIVVFIAVPVFTLILVNCVKTQISKTKERKIVKNIKKFNGNSVYIIQSKFLC